MEEKQVKQHLPVQTSIFKGVGGAQFFHMLFVLVKPAQKRKARAFLYWRIARLFRRRSRQSTYPVNS
jgi:hypothetical protein